MSTFNRRSFIKNSCRACGALAIAGTALTTLESCSPLPVYKTAVEQQKIKIPISELALTPKKLIRASDLDYDILLVKNPTGQIHAMVMKCTHEDWLLSAGPQSINCTAHGSTFDFDGKVTNGPAINPLLQLPVNIEKDIVYILINL